MNRYKCIIQYDGTHFSGFQVQPNRRTVQSEIESALKRMHKQSEIRIIPSGRTDAGVHAMGQVIHFDSPLKIEESAWKKALSSLLPNDIHIVELERISNEFHARYNVKRKEYRYRIWNHPEPNIFKRNYTYFVKESLNLDAMKKACVELLGTHDFTSLSSAKSEVKGDKVRTLYEVDCFYENEEIVVKVVGSGFLYNMVRIIVGTLVEVGKGARQPEDLTEVIAARDRAAAGKTAPPQGLYLWEVTY
ncbi:tRNA pseudouridine(38-40) synthase TruA [Salirhabdus sp. Marseille-P4669]|uniref:tRNA pseudouridine(38-40) synthase TruA n=1 Tax=Salirhabdus sp. Marseille-P4669 TaxID=2042310 RepID=UPI000C7E036C|nr:tRNA pseudouridine(38-40) synthase TruA [Salirhabdus sp. Marseille-P4669]